MPQIKASIKTVKTDAAKRAANAVVRSQIHTATKKAVAAANTADRDAALRNAISVIDSAAAKGILHKNNAARKKSRLNARVKAAIAAEARQEAKQAEVAKKEAEKEAYKEAMEESK